MERAKSLLASSSLPATNSESETLFKAGGPVEEFATGYRLKYPNFVRYVTLDGDSILMEHVDGLSLLERLTTKGRRSK